MDLVFAVIVDLVFAVIYFSWLAGISLAAHLVIKEHL